MRYYICSDSNFLAHHGVKGMKWGVRRYQNYDGTRIKSGRSNESRVEIAKRYFSGDTDARRKEDALYKKEQEEFKKIGPPPKTFWGKDGKLSAEGREYLDKTDKVQEKYDKQYRKLWDEHNAERGEQSKKVFLDEAVEPEIKKAKETLDRMDSLYEKHLGISSDNYTKALQDYLKARKSENDPEFDREDAEYGFDHYEWREGHKAFDDAYKNYHKEADALEKQYEDQIIGIGKLVLEDQYEKYAEDSMFEVDQFVRFRYDELVSDKVVKHSDELYHHGVKGMKWGVRRYQNYDGTRIGVSKSQHYNRNKYNTNVPKTVDDAKARGWNGGVSANAHQRKTKPGKRNVKYVSPDGHREGIYDTDGKLVGGSYNYSSPIDDKAGHLINDVIPYIKYGSSPNDKTTALKRTEDLLGLYGAEKVRKDIASIGKDYAVRLNNDKTVKVNTGLSMPTPTMYSEKYDPAPRHTGPNPRKQSLKNTIYGTLSGHYLRNKLNKNLPMNDADAEAKGWRKLSDKDSAMHQFFKEDGVRNSKWVSPDGHREVVFTGKGDNQHRTTHAEDAGTYNFFDPKKHPIGHATLDVLPYVFLGNSADDSTTVVTRLSESYKNFKNKAVDSIDTATASVGEQFAKKHKVA